MPTLRELQQAMRSSLLQGHDGTMAAFIAADGFSPAARLGIYRNTFIGSLTGALRLSYPAVHRLVGAEFFDAAAQLFIVERPPSGAYLDEYGAGFADFLGRFTPAASLPYLADVARLEWQVNRALHAPDADSLDVLRLDAVAEDDRDRLCFEPHPSIGLVRSAYPVDALWRAVLARNDAAIAAIDMKQGPVWLFVGRGNAGIEVARLGEAAWRFTASLCAGTPLQVALDQAAGIDAPALLAAYLAGGLFADFTLASPTETAA